MAQIDADFIRETSVCAVIHSMQVTILYIFYYVHCEPRRGHKSIHVSPRPQVLLALLLLEDGADTSPNELGRLSGVNRLPNSSLLVVVDHGSGLGVVCAQPFLEGLGVIVRSLDKGLSSLVIGHCLLGWVDYGIKSATAQAVIRENRIVTGSSAGRTFFVV